MAEERTECRVPPSNGIYAGLCRAMTEWIPNRTKTAISKMVAGVFGIINIRKRLAHLCSTFMRASNCRMLSLGTFLLTTLDTIGVEI